ncbi:MAG: hypothetical protein ACR2HJ_05620 [Fimbriimonadales bacterium]
MKYAAGAIALFLAACANAQWTVVNLHPAGATQSAAFGIDGGLQGGYAEVGGVVRASLWTGTAGSWVDLHPAGARESLVYGVGGGQQVGYAGVGRNLHASLWSGTAGSWVDLNPSEAVQSEAFGVHSGQQAGYAIVGGDHHASLWSGTAKSWVDLNPAGSAGSWAFGVGGGQQVGFASADGVARASLWSGTANSWVDLNPAGSSGSLAFAVSNGQQVGTANVGDYTNASLWTGSADSWVNLHSGGANHSYAYAVHDGQQVGFLAVFNGTLRASLWTGTAGSRVDLQRFLPPQFDSSVARGVWRDGAFTYVVGFGHNPKVPRYEALMWVSRASAPASYSMFRGSVISGNLASLQESDDNRLVIRPGAVFSNAEPPIQIILDARAPTSSPSAFSFSLESNASIANAEQRISLYNYVTGLYEVLDTRPATISDDTVNVTVNSNPSRFIQHLSLAIRARVSYRAVGSAFVYPWLSSIDRAWWAFPG